MLHRFSHAAIVAAFMASAAQANGGLAHVDQALAVAQRCESDACLYSWTLTTRFGQALHIAEKLYGERDPSWTLLGVEFTTAVAPQVWYPRFEDGDKLAVVQVTADAATNQRRALFQMSHEVVHLLSPLGPGGHASWLEEGLATYFSLQYVTAVGFQITPDFITDARYRSAYDDVAILASLHPKGGFERGVQALRRRLGRLSHLSAADIKTAFPQAPAALTAALARNFPAPH